MSTIVIVFILLSVVLAITNIYDFFKEPKDIRFYIFSLLISFTTLVTGTIILITQ